MPTTFRSLISSAAAAALIRAAFAEQGPKTDPPSSALKESDEAVAGKLEEGGGFAAFAKGEIVALVLYAGDGDAL